MSLQDYHQCVTGALDRLQEEGIILPEQRGRLLSSALRAYHEAR